ncbi:MAG: hypothetical protein QHC78_21070, partial [Pigmentiphaga sp.]|uniref:hypothetical protein n=1 Tax=Pigmentiphaga sp. TaxID=1977564 RepID=UPI0029A187E1
MRFTFLPLLLALAPAISADVAVAPVAMAQSDGGFQAYLESLRPKARAMGIRDATMNAVFPTLTSN